ncbi:MULTISPECIES: ABC transporter ATP-binding protein [Sphingobacterium]|jgi:ABC-2 type transport system ATP-binding protein|uniref:ABC transporter ATP-binding protein n=1 Tax=Sphingobacterium anhuiense TaxID=493780 RepID=A0ABW5Z1V9_9SPHI|nr:MULTISPECIES: ABC transporter ATP-binding protein [unclassified Sphingobacterium]MCS3554810.1 ABC-2 type transport system ATP-binding protein [Sphingobacterium sp. JUb21]NJI73682.1 ABC transporter ATP-binding protein [Sphingobacterium sp. B16(2022)]TCR05793.1 ABC-2 type transport system ATP-binding protein [Sphingobacterium sp. JUb20]
MDVSKPIIRISNLRKSYGSKEILKGINLDIYPGQVIGYIGPNGAGKSTTVKILTGLINDFEGEVFINDIDIKEDPLTVKSQIGYVPENAELYDVLTPMEYLDFVGKLYGMEDTLIQQRAQQLLKAFGLEENLNNRMDTFSKGMRQKVLLISGIIHNPQIIILDEPLSGLDANAVIIVKELISLLAKEGKTIFYCSHMMDVVEKVSDRIMLISEGNIIADGSFEQLKTNQSDTLEQIFSKLTGKEDGNIDASHIISAIR